MTRILLSAVAFDAGTQIRAAIDQQVVTDYAEAMTSGAIFPAIVLFNDGNQHYLADGFHRFMAAQRIQARDIDADVRPGTKEDALWFALGANRTNGRRLTEDDKTHAVSLALRAWPDRLHTEIADQVGCSRSLVSKVSSKSTGESGRRSLTGLALRNHAKREALNQLIETGATDRDEIATKTKTSVAFVSKVRGEMGKIATDRSLSGQAKRREQIRDMAVEGYSSHQVAAKLELTEEGCRKIAREIGVVFTADKALSRAHRHDSARIVEHIVMDAENLTADINLIDFASLDRERLGVWADSLIASKKALDSFIKRLIKEQQKHGEAA